VEFHTWRQVGEQLGGPQAAAGVIISLFVPHDSAVRFSTCASLSPPLPIVEVI